MEMIRNTFANLIEVGSMSLEVVIDTFYEDRTETYDDDEIRKVRWLVATVPPPPPSIQVGRRSRTNSVPVKPTVVHRMRVYPYTYDSDPLTWPPPLRRWWVFVRDPDEALLVARHLREHYADDEELLAAAEWLESASRVPNVSFEFR
jgi:hypothetical protein